MAYHELVYLIIFLPLTMITYQITPQKWRWKVLLFASYLFFWFLSGKLLLVLIGSSIFTHYIGLWLGYLRKRCEIASTGCDRAEAMALKTTYKKYEKAVLGVGIFGMLTVLAFLKYFNFFADNVNVLMRQIGIDFALTRKTLVLPIGISFYTLSSISYMVDVYWKKIEPELHLGKVALFLSFFPHIMEGPICSYTQTADSLWSGNKIREKNVSAGARRILWGLFKKIVIADRLYVIVTQLFDQYNDYHGVMILVAAVAYTAQLYMEFSGSIDIVIGSGRLFGITLPENFRQPFCAQSASEFWRRWHISLGVWFKTYIFYPISVSGTVKKWNKFARARFGKYFAKVGVSAMALFPVWLCNGLWHGASWNYIFYGLYYFCILLLEVVLDPFKDRLYKKIQIQKDNIVLRMLRILRTWGIILIGELFFRAEGLKVGFRMLRSMFRSFDIQQLWDGSLMNLGLDRADYAVVGMGILVVAVVGWIKEKQILTEDGFFRLWLPARWAVYYSLFFAVVILGAYGIGYQQVDLIYAGF